MSLSIEELISEAKRGSDADLPTSDRRDRQRISQTLALAEGTRVWEGKQECFVAGPGRGEGWLLLVWEDDGNQFIGTVHESRIAQTVPRTEEPPPRTEEPTPRTR